MNPLVSIIIPVYNKGDVLSETLESVINQSYTNWECILIDDNSSDYSVSIIMEYLKKDVRFVYSPRPKEISKGGNACRNYGFGLSRGDLIQWFDSDDLMLKDKIKEKVQKFIFGQYDFVVCEGVEFENTISDLGYKWNKIYSDNPFIDHAIGKIAYHTNGPMFSRKFLNGKRLFDLRLQRKQEWEFYTRLLSFEPNIGLINKALYAYRIHDNSINGRDSISTLSSRIRADLLVFKTLKRKSSNFSERMPHIRKHFINKTIYKFRIAYENRHMSNMIYSIIAIFKYLSLQLIYKTVIKKIKKLQK